MLSPIGGLFVQAEFNDLMALVSIVMRDKRVRALKRYFLYKGGEDLDPAHDCQPFDC